VASHFNFQNFTERKGYAPQEKILEILIDLLNQFLNLVYYNLYFCEKRGGETRLVNGYRRILAYQKLAFTGFTEATNGISKKKEKKT